MYLYPKELDSKLEFDQIRELLAERCIGEPAIKIALRLKPFTNQKKVEYLLVELEEYVKLKSWSNESFVQEYQDISPALQLLSTPGYVLDLEDYLHIRSTVFQTHRLIEQKSIITQDEYPKLHAIILQIEWNEALIEIYKKIFSETGEVKPNASDRLLAISKEIDSKDRELQRSFARILTQYKKLGYLGETMEGIRNGRRVLNVLAEYKRKIKGVIHDESSTGKTVYLEPNEIVQLNNDLSDLDAQWRAELYNIFRGLSAELHPYIDSLSLWQKIIVRLDLIEAKYKLSTLYDGIVPKLNNSGEIELSSTYHPLLYIKNQNEGKTTIPFSLKLNSQERILVISGPNAGGKSVTLKTIGLQQLMLQSGLMVTGESNSIWTMYNKILIDIGDQQSIDSDLSTYSSRLIIMNEMVKSADRKSLVLIDEFGSGSDPALGGAIAEAVLHELVHKKSMAVITTHYANIKEYAYKSKAIINAAMLFDQDHLTPMYRLEVGNPGSSFAYELATKIGLPNEIIKYAKKKTGSKQNQVEKILSDLQKEKAELEEKLLEVYDEKHRLKTLISSYEQLKNELDIRRRKLKIKNKEQDLTRITALEQELKGMIDQIKATPNLDMAQKIVKKIKQNKSKLISESQEINTKLHQEEIKATREIRIGDIVQIRDGDTRGEVTEINKDKIKVVAGLLTLEINKSNVQLIENPIKYTKKSVRLKTNQRTERFESQLDIRGYTAIDAMETIQKYLDEALLHNTPQLTVLHGKGSGILKKIVWQKAKEYKDVKRIYHPDQGENTNIGVTIIDF